MRSIDWLQLGLFVLAIALITKPMGLYTRATTLEGATQTIVQGPVASQIAIKMK